MKKTIAISLCVIYNKPIKWNYVEECGLKNLKFTNIFPKHPEKSLKLKTTKGGVLLVYW